MGAREEAELGYLNFPELSGHVAELVSRYNSRGEL
jgi:hypothetical protein